VWRGLGFGTIRLIRLDEHQGGFRERNRHYFFPGVESLVELNLAVSGITGAAHDRLVYSNSLVIPIP
jgi:hypothetical protein